MPKVRDYGFGRLIQEIEGDVVGSDLYVTPQGKDYLLERREALMKELQEYIGQLWLDELEDLVLVAKGMVDGKATVEEGDNNGG